MSSNPSRTVVLKIAPPQCRSFLVDYIGNYGWEEVGNSLNDNVYKLVALRTESWTIGLDTFDVQYRLEATWRDGEKNSRVKMSISEGLFDWTKSHCESFVIELVENFERRLLAPYTPTPTRQDALQSSEERD